MTGIPYAVMHSILTTLPSKMLHSSINTSLAVYTKPFIIYCTKT